MNTEKLKGTLGCVGVSALFVALLLLLGLSLKILPPLKTCRYTIQIWSVDRNSNEGDSMYIACMNQKADIFEKKGHDKRCLNARKEILDYYTYKGDSLSVDYALAKYKYYLAKEDAFIEVTEWTNGEGWDISIDDKIFTLTSGQLEAINYLTKTLEYDRH